MDVEIAAAKVDVGMGTDPMESAPVVPTLLIDVEVRSSK